MAHSKSALKRWRQNEAHRERNKAVRTGARTAVKKAHAAAASGESSDAVAAIAEAASILDRAAKRHVIHKNAASRHKSRMARQMNKVAAGTTVEAPKKGRKAPAKAPAKTAAKKTAANTASKPRATRAKAAPKS
ncbi:MAG: 30S ribosomal protein S20 [Chloroflexi bacterium]|nr:30S ribosomal protein S20 [Chloroflexota bacterium]